MSRVNVITRFGHIMQEFIYIRISQYYGGH
jgi:hypothetical protein